MSGKWYVIWTANPGESLRGQEQHYQVAELGSSSLRKLPAVGSAWGTGVVTLVQGSFPSEKAAEAVIGAPGHPTGTGEGSGAGHANPTGPNLPKNPLGDFLRRLGEANTWIRVAEVILGLGLIIVGLAKLASGTAAGKAALKAGETAAIL